MRLLENFSASEDHSYIQNDLEIASIVRKL